MEKYICDKCGFIQEKDEQSDLKRVDGGILYFSCDICRGKLISEEQMKEKEEIARLTEEDTKDDDLTPEQDMKEVIMDFLTFSMEKNIKEVGNLRTYQFIEEEKRANIRLRYRYYFILAGGQIPENNTIGQLSEGGNIKFTI